jgi:hypothetical protein
LNVSGLNLPDSTHNALGILTLFDFTVDTRVSGGSGGGIGGGIGGGVGILEKKLLIYPNI